MDGERGAAGGGGGGQEEVEDEFACAGMLRGSLTSLHGTVERIFRVRFGIGADTLPQGNNGQIWLKLQGQRGNVKAAKLFVKGVVNQEEQQEVSYPRVLHCVFCGARGLFMDCLIKSTSAHILVGSPGFLLISGLAEPVVRAYSLITELVERYKGTLSRHSETVDRGSGESLDSRRAFKSLVEKWEDRHILDLLVLPASVKEILLNLVNESGLGSSSNLIVTDGNGRSGDESLERWDKASVSMGPLCEPFNTTDHLDEELATALSLSTPPGTRGWAEGEERLMRCPEKVGEEQAEQREAVGTSQEDGVEEDEEDRQLSTGNKEFWLLLRFFTAMGYTEDVVKRVLAQTGPKEASQILDLVQQEQDHSDRRQMLGPGGPDGVTPDRSERNRPCETEHRDDEEAGAGRDTVRSSNGEVGGDQQGEESGATGCTTLTEGGSSEEKEEGHEDDFVLGVLKKAAASCGYTEQTVARVYNMLPDRSTHHLLLELQREEGRETDGVREGPTEMDDVVLEREEPSDDDGWVEIPTQTAPDVFSWGNKPQQLPVSQHTSQPKQHQPVETQTPQQIISPEVKGPPMPTYPSSLDAPLTNLQTTKQCDQTIYWPDPPTSKQNHSTNDNVSQSYNSVRQELQDPTGTRNNSSPAKSRERQGFEPVSSVVVTGQQRFLEGLQMPFDLQLTDKPGDPKLRTIVIDGSNVAMSHGLGHFFSCRGIALAVQHFWDRGHRDISALLPQWRQKSDSRIKEQHYLMALQKLGLLAYTPSREVHGKRISSYDDRFMLQLAQKTDGVIVTNDNLRDLSDESPVWRDIIKKRLLQYTFVGDHFMVPDDPLGRGGPHLDDFLRTEHRTPDPGNHSFAGVASTFPSSKPPRSQTEVLNFRDRTLGGGVDPAGRGGRWRGKGRGKAADLVHQQRQHGAAGADRDRAETASLREKLHQIFPGQDNMVTLMLQCYPAETDINVLSELILEKQKD